MNAPADVASIVTAAKTPELVGLERQLEEALAAIKVASSELPKWMERADRSIMPALVAKNDTTMAAADARVAEIRATIAALSKVVDALRSKIAETKPAFAAAVRSGVAPIRARAAADIQLASRTLYEAVASYNLTSAALDQAGVPRPLVVPMRIPTLDHFVDKVASEDLA